MCIRDRSSSWYPSKVQLDWPFIDKQGWVQCRRWSASMGRIWGLASGAFAWRIDHHSCKTVMAGCKSQSCHSFLPEVFPYWLFHCSQGFPFYLFYCFFSTDIMNLKQSKFLNRAYFQRVLPQMDFNALLGHRISVPNISLNPYMSWEPLEHDSFVERCFVWCTVFLLTLVVPYHLGDLITYNFYG